MVEFGNIFLRVIHQLISLRSSLSVIIYVILRSNISLEMLRKVVLGSVGAVALIPTINAATPVTEKPNGPVKPPPMRPSDLPIYEAPHADYGEFLQSKSNEEESSYIKSALLTPVRTVREQTQSLLEHTESWKHTVQDNYHEFQDKSEWIVKYLREEENKEVRYGAVAMGGLTGFIFGLRGGIIRRVFYAGVGTTAMGMVCFPEETKEQLKGSSNLAKQYINIAYNFLYGGTLKESAEDCSVSVL